uniref:Ig-like domain-containing protein n=1 Tax=Strongyloides stercoralis TaxID=6248 RepID=A0A0K0E6K7_STRER
MKFYSFLLLLYALNLKISNNYYGFVDANNRYGQYHCTQNSNENRLFVIINMNHIIDKSEHYYYMKKEKDVPAVNDYVLHSVVPNTNLKFKQIKKFIIPIKNLYYNIHNKYEDIRNNIHFLICPYSTQSNLYTKFTELDENKPLTVYMDAARCSIYKCTIGIYPRATEYMNTVDKILQGGQIDFGIFIGFKDSPAENLDSIYFYAGYYKKAGHTNIPLVACPYINWVVRQSLAKFTPDPLVTEKFPLLPDDNKRHILIPAYILKKVKRPKDATDRFTFTCGTLEQDKNFTEAGPIKIGYEFDIDEKIIARKFKVDKNNFYCGDLDITNYYLFSFIDSGDLLGKQTPEMEPVTSTTEQKFYYNQVFYAYKKNDILEKYKNNEERFFDEDHYPPVFHAECITRHDSEVGKLTPKIGERLQAPRYRPVVKGGEEVETYIIDLHEQKGQDITCHVSLFKNTDQRYSDFYSKAFATRIQKVFDADGKEYSGEPSPSIKVTGDEKTDIGVYRCTLHSTDVVEVLDSEFHLLSGKLSDQKTIVEESYSNKDMFKCELVNINKQFLIKMQVTIPKQKAVTYYMDKKKNEKNKNFKERFNYITYHPNDESDYKTDTVVKCIYKNDETNDETVVEKKVDIKDKPKEDKFSKKILIPIIVGVSVFIIIILAIVAFLVIKKRRDKKRLELLSNATNSTSKSKSKSSTSGSKSISKSSNSTSKSKTKKSKSRSKATSGLSKNSKSKYSTTKSSTSQLSANK